ncbi:hypothetical protein HMPREF3097_07665 [Corynebacterium sp. HMSC27B11]|nr:hypothetical protein HMPREF3097_07665 [Corynebacterium sp. HMSC27B11]
MRSDLPGPGHQFPAVDGDPDFWVEVFHSAFCHEQYAAGAGGRRVDGAGRDLAVEAVAVAGEQNIDHEATGITRNVEPNGDLPVFRR